MRPKKPSSAAVVAAQARTKTNSEQNVESLTQTRTEIRKHPKTGRQQLVAVFPGVLREEPNEVTLNYLLNFPGLEPMFSTAFLQWGDMLEPLTRAAAAKSLSTFFRYLKKHWGLGLEPDDIDDELLIGFRSVLLDEPRGNGKPLSQKSVTAYLGVLRSVLGALDSGVWSKSARAISVRVPSSPTGSHRKGAPIEVLGLNVLLAIIDAAEKEVLEVRERFLRGKALLAEGRGRQHITSPLKKNVGQGYGDYYDLQGCLAGVDLAYAAMLPKLTKIAAQHPQLERSIRSLHGHGRITSYLYPSSRDLVPFALLLTFATLFNPATVLKLDWQDVDFEKEHAGRRAVEITGEKKRGSRDLVRLLDPQGGVSSKLSLQQLLETLKDISCRLRTCIVERHSDRIFVFGLEQGKEYASSFDSIGAKKARSSSDTIWNHALEQFYSQNSLPKFSLAQLRRSVLDLVQFTHGDLETAQKVGNHGSPVTTWVHYTSDGIKKRYRERIGQIVIMRERWFQTGGDIDPRRLTAAQDKGAATPGFSCLDPFDSPRPNQIRGKLCKDYGGCPSCPMVAAHPGDPICVGQYMALERAIYRSQPAMSSKTWLDRWVPVLADLKALQTHIPDTVLAESRKISIELPNVG